MLEANEHQDVSMQLRNELDRVSAQQEMFKGKEASWKMHQKRLLAEIEQLRQPRQRGNDIETEEMHDLVHTLRQELDKQAGETARQHEEAVMWKGKYAAWAQKHNPYTKSDDDIEKDMGQIYFDCYSFAEATSFPSM